MWPWAFTNSNTRALDEVRALAETTRFDYYCWDLYARVTEWYEEDKTRLKIRTAALHAIEHGGNPTADLAAFIADRIVRCHLKTMRRLNIDYDLLTWEGDILRLHFWSHAFEFLKQTGAVFLQTEGRLKGCWVMRIDEDDATADAPAEADAVADDDAEPRRRRRRRTAREGDRPVRRHGYLRRQGHGLSALEVRAARQGLPLPGIRRTLRRGAALVDDLPGVSGGPRPAGLRPGGLGLQRHRHAAGVPPETAEASVGGPRVRGPGRPLGSLFVRNGRALAQHRAGAWLHHRRGIRSPVRRGVRAQRTGRQSR